MKTKPAFKFFACFLLFFSQISYAQIQVGEDIIRQDSVFIGYSLAISHDGKVVAAGNPFAELNPANFITEGILSMYELIDDQWVEMGSPIVGSVGATFVNSHTGWAAALSNDGRRVAVSAVNYSQHITDFRANIRVFDYDGTEWNFNGGFVGGALLGGGEFSDIEMSGDGSTILGVGRYFNHNTNQIGDKIHIYEFNGDYWKPKGTDNTFGAGGNFATLSEDGDRIAIGYNSPDTLAPDTIKVYDFIDEEWVANGGVFPITELNYSTIDVSYFSFGENGNRLAIGYPTADGIDTGTGQVLVYEYDGSNWEPLGMPIIGIEGNYEVGKTVEMAKDGNRILVGANEHDLINKLLIYEWDGQNWNHITKGSSVGGGFTRLSGDGQSILSWKNVGVAVYNQFSPNCTKWVDQGSEWYHIILPEGASGGYEHTILDTTFFSDSLQTDVYVFKNTSFWQDIFYCDLQSYVTDSIYTWAIDSTIYLNGDTIACFKTDISKWTYTKDFGGNGIVDYVFTRKDVREEIFGSETLTGYYFDLNYETSAGLNTRTDLSFFEKIGFLESRIDFYERYPVIITSVAEPICVRYEGSDLIKINDYSGPCDTLPICNPLHTEDLFIASEIAVFPNPTTGEMYWSSSANKVSLIEVRNNVGKLISDFETGIDFINLEIVPAGIYFLTFEVEDRVVVKKVIRL